MDENTKNGTGTNQGGEHDEGDDLDARISKLLDAKLNSALSNRDKRLQASLAKTLEEQLARLAPKTGEAGGGNGNAGGTQGGEGTGGNAGGAQTPRTDPEIASLRETLSKMQKQVADAETARINAERSALRDKTHTALRTQLIDAGVTPARAAVLIPYLEATGDLRVNEETGVYEMAVKRVRTRGGTRPEEVIFDDLGAAVKDWTQTEFAAEFITAQTGAQQRQTGVRPGAQRATPGANTSTTNGAVASRGKQPADPLAGLTDDDFFGS